MASTTTAARVETQQRTHIAPEGFKRNILQTFDVPGTKYETVIVLAELRPNATTGRHQHPGIESGFVTAGEGTMFAEGQPPIALKTGQSYRLPLGVKHEMKSGQNGMTAVAFWVLEKGKPAATSVT